MSARAKRPTDDPDDVRTAIYDPDGRKPAIETPVTTVDDPRRRAHKPTAKGVPRGPAAPAIEQPTPTSIDPHPPTDMVDAALAQQSELRVISMKAGVAAEKKAAQRKELQVQLRSIADVKRADTPVDLGRLAPPRDPREVRARRLRDNVIWACVAIILACGVTLAIWFLARR